MSIEAAANSLINQADDGLDNILSPVLKGDSEALKRNASRFLQEAENCIIKIQNINQKESIKQRIKTLVSKEGDISSLQQELDSFKNLEISKAEFQRFMQLIFDFQNNLNNFLGQQVEVIYVYVGKSGTPELWRLNDSGKEVTKTLASKGRGLSARYKNFSQKYLQRNAELIEKTDMKINVAGLQSAYTETSRRGSLSRLKIGSLLILWRPGGVWQKMLVSSQGDINEAYAAFYLQNSPPPSFDDGDIEILIDQFLTSGPNSVQNVDNISGLLEGDVSQGEIEYAIKSKGASTLSYNQVIDMAVLLSEMPVNEITEDFLKNYKQKLHDKGSTRNKILTEYMEKDVQSVIDEILKPLSSL